MKKLVFFQKKHPQFVYRGYSYKVTADKLKIVFDFQIKPDISFKPEIIIKNIKKSKLKRIEKRALNNLIFHLGLAEIPSYWKTTCSPEIEIRAGRLNQEQIRWWQGLIARGMGQFFYENKLPFIKPSIRPKVFSADNETGADIASYTASPLPLKNRYLVPMREGKDSIVTLEKLKKQKKEINVFCVNPTPAAGNVLKVAGIKHPITVERKIDPKLLELNRRGYLNGHTPFTAVLSFSSVFCAVLFDYKHIAFSNERSANEGNVKYLGKTINHQWSKSSEFERKFKDYCKKYLAKNINYFSYLRKYTELEIAEMFSKYLEYFPFFLSCNEAYKTDSGRKKPKKKWCGQCPKCLFVYAILYPFLEKKQLIKIFGKDLFEDEKLLPLMKSLIGEGSRKPFECVGTYKESRKALKLSSEKAEKEKRETPYLLTKFKTGDIIQYQGGEVKK